MYMKFIYYHAAMHAYWYIRTYHEIIEIYWDSD